MFIRDLIRQFNEESRNWRKTTILQWDGAAYHQGKSIMNTLKELDIPIMISAPHSYEMSPCELMFAAIKSGDINPRNFKLGKK